MSTLSNLGATAVYPGSPTSHLYIAPNTGSSLPLGGGIFYVTKFAAPAAADEYKLITSLVYTLPLYLSPGTNTELYALYGKTIRAYRIIGGSVDLQTVTWGTLPEREQEPAASYTSAKTGTSDTATFSLAPEMLSELQAGGLLLTCDDGYGVTAKVADASALLVAEYGSSVRLELSLDPTAGYCSKSKKTTLRWNAAPSGPSWTEPVQTGAVVEWKSDDDPGTVHQITVTGATAYAEIAANTFSAEATAVSWRVLVTASSGVTTTSDWVTFAVVEPQGTVTASEPSGRVFSTWEAIPFSWVYTNATGSLAKGAELQKSTDGTTWAALKTVAGSECVTTLAAGSLASGGYWWRVRAKNQDNVWSEWSDALYFIVVGKPGMPAVRWDTRNHCSFRPSLSWTAVEQEAFEIRQDGVTIVREFGQTRGWTAKDVLSAGVHRFAVRVQNQFGLWSDWGETTVTARNSSTQTSGMLTVTNTGDGNVSIAVNIGSTSYPSVISLYRDGILLAEKSGKTLSLTDRMACIGEHVWSFIGYYQMGLVYDEGVVDYGSATYAASVTDAIAFSDIILTRENGEQARCPYTLDKGIQLRRSGGTALTHYAGGAYPEAESSGEKDLTLHFSPSFPASLNELAERFAALDGETVHYRDPMGHAFYGVLSVSSEKRLGSARVFTASIARVAHEGV